MRALTVVPGVGGSTELTELSEPDPATGELLVDALALGVCGTDREIAAGEYGWPPPGRERLVLGHESLGVVADAPLGGDVRAGDLVVGIVRRPDPVPCAACARGEFDMCRNGRYRERGIKELDGYGSERWRVEADYCVVLDPALRSVGVLMEPTSILAKAWEQVERIGRRATWEPRRALVTGAGPIGLLAALLGIQRDLDVHVLDRVTSGRKPGLVRALGATYHSGPADDVVRATRPDVVIEATGAVQVVSDVMRGNAPGAVVCLTGVSPSGRELTVDVGATVREIVLENDVVLGSVNANRRHYALAAEALEAADRGWLDELITRRVALERWHEALEQRPDDVKVVLELG